MTTSSFRSMTELLIVTNGWMAGRLPERPERGAQLVGEDPGLLPGGEVATLVNVVVVDEAGVRALRPAPRRLVLLAGKDADGDRDRDTLGVEETAPVFPVQPGRRDSGVRQPIEGDVVEDLVARQFAGRARRPVQAGDDRR